MEVIIQPDPAAASLLAARRIGALIRNKPQAVLGLAIGSAHKLVYSELIRMYQNEGLDFSQVSTFNFDEYLGLPPAHPSSCYHFMRENLFDQININIAQTHVPDGCVSRAEMVRSCAEYEGEIRDSGGIDLQILGIGSDGRVGFHEHGSSLVSRTQMKTFSPRILAENMRRFASDVAVPRHVITMGIGTIMEARSILLLAFGENKAVAAARAVEGPITGSNPASILQAHLDAAFYLDESAATRLNHSEQYRWAFEQKQEWQSESSDCEGCLQL